MANRTFIEVSKVHWSRPDGSTDHDTDAIKIGCFQRIANALESIASNVAYQSNRISRLEEQLRKEKIKATQLRKKLKETATHENSNH